MTSQQEQLRQLPSVTDLADQLCQSDLDAPRLLCIAAARVAVDQRRAKILNNDADNTPLLECAVAELRALSQPPLKPAINATGIIIHTGLGRAPLSTEAARAMSEVADVYAPVELDLDAGARGHRTNLVRSLLTELTGAGNATVCNNTAAALVLSLSTLAKGMNTLVSRGQLVEIGGSFRLPDVIHAGGSRLREVGTTNKTRLSDYERAIDHNTGAILVMHCSNYRIEGFTESCSIRELAKLGKERRIPVIHDIGSGLLSRRHAGALPGDEPDVERALSDGANLVMFSGDKLLSGPQAGIIVGDHDLIERIEKNPMMRAMRLDKIRLAALAVTLQQNLDPQQAQLLSPVMRMVSMTPDDLRPLCEQLVVKLKSSPGIASIDIVDSQSYLGGGSVPTQAIPSIAVAITPAGRSANDTAARLRSGVVPIIARIHNDQIHFDLRTVLTPIDEVASLIGQAFAG